MLRMRKTPFIIALNKIDRMYDWETQKDAATRDTLAAQKSHARAEFEDRAKKVMLEFANEGLNAAIYWDNPDPRKFINVVPTSAITGEGIPDLIHTLVDLTQTRMNERLQFFDAVQCTVLEVKMIEGLGTTMDVILINGTLREGQTIVVAGIQGPIVTTIRALLTPQPRPSPGLKSSRQDQLSGASRLSKEDPRVHFPRSREGCVFGLQCPAVRLRVAFVVDLVSVTCDGALRRLLLARGSAR